MKQEVEAFPADAVAKSPTQSPSLPGIWVRSLVRELDPTCVASISEDCRCHNQRPGTAK